MQIGAQPVWDPHKWPEILTGSRSLREQLRRAKAKSVRMRMLEPYEIQPGTRLRASIETLTSRWLSSRGAAPMKFLLEVELFSYFRERRVYAAMLGDALVGVLNAVPIYARNGWFFEDILRDPLAPNGTAELLIDAAMRQAVDERSSMVTMGMVPLAGNVPYWIRTARKMGGAIYDFDGLRRFREKLHPDDWEPVLLRYPESQMAFTAVWDSLRAVMGQCPFAWAFQGMKTAEA